MSVKRRFIVDTEAILSNKKMVQISGQEARHLSRILRLGIGERVELIDGMGYHCHGIIKGLFKKTGAVEVLKEGDVVFDDDRLPVTLLAGAMRGEKGDLVVEKATELGARRIVFVQTERAVSRPGANRIKRWQEKALQALKQCKGYSIPEISRPLEWKELKEALIASPEIDLKVALFPPHSSDHSLRRLCDLVKETVSYITLFVGPEGGFSLREVEELMAIGFKGASLGSRVLRAETACIAALSIVAGCILCKSDER